MASASQVYPHPGFRRMKDKLKYVVRGLITPRLTLAWFRLLSDPALAPFARLNPRILSKLQRPYVHRHLRARARLRLLEEHYRFVAASFAAGTLAELLRRPGIVLAEIVLEDVGALSLRLFYSNRFEKEGELTVALHDEGQREFISALSFCVSSFTPNPAEIFIGGLQGFQIPNQKERTIAITRGMHGLRPKALLLFVVQELAGLWGIPTLRAVSNDNTVFRDPRLRKKVIHASYDEFWIESGGRAGGDGNFTLPATFVRRDLMELKPTKRTLHRRRYEMLEALAAQVRERVARMTLSGTSEPGSGLPLMAGTGSIRASVQGGVPPVRQLPA